MPDEPDPVGLNSSARLHLLFHTERQRYGNSRARSPGHTEAAIPRHACELFPTSQEKSERNAGIKQVAVVQRQCCPSKSSSQTDLICRCNGRHTGRKKLHKIHKSEWMQVQSNGVAGRKVR